MSEYTAGSYEVEILHPATADWLDVRGYIYDHHVKMPVSGVADFVAMSQDGKMLIIETKRDASNIRLDIQQAKDYRDQYDPTADVAIAIPRGQVTDKARELAKLTRVQLIELEGIYLVLYLDLETDADILNFLRPELATYFDPQGSLFECFGPVLREMFRWGWHILAGSNLLITKIGRQWPNVR